LKKNKLTQAGVIEKVLRMIEARDTGKQQYKEADQLLEELLPLLKVGESIELGNGEVATLVDNFDDKNKAWKPCGINRFDIETTRAKRLAPAKAEAKGPEPAAP
jgi:hypothetical protein